MAKRDQITIYDVAKHLKVSPSTVSMVINNSPGIPPDTREKVMDAIKRLNYRPSLLGRGLAKNRTYTIAVIVPQIEKIFIHPYFALAVSGVYEQATQMGYKLILEMATYEFVRRKRYLRLFREKSVDGIIYVGSTSYDTYLKEVAEAGYPFVLIGAYLPGIKISYVTGDNFKGGYLATSHLLKAGYKRVGLITGSFNVISALDRFKGYKRALKESGIKFEPGWVKKGRFDEAGGYEAMKELLKKKVKAVFAGNDLMASGAYRAIKEAGLKIPEDIAVVGMDNLPGSIQLEPPLTTVSYPIYEMAKTGCRRLLEIVKNETPQYFAEVLPVKLLVRDSSKR